MILLGAILMSMIVLKRIVLDRITFRQIKEKMGVYPPDTPIILTHEREVKEDDRKICYDYIYRRKPTSYFFGYESIKNKYINPRKEYFSFQSLYLNNLFDGLSILTLAYNSRIKALDKTNRLIISL